jgi:hypothetical protein
MLIKSKGLNRIILFGNGRFLSVGITIFFLKKNLTHSRRTREGISKNNTIYWLTEKKSNYILCLKNLYTPIFFHLELLHSF